MKNTNIDLLLSRSEKFKKSEARLQKITALWMIFSFILVIVYVAVLLYNIFAHFKIPFNLEFETTFIVFCILSANMIISTIYKYVSRKTLAQRADKKIDDLIREYKNAIKIINKSTPNKDINKLVQLFYSLSKDSWQSQFNRLEDIIKQIPVPASFAFNKIVYLKTEKRKYLYDIIQPQMAAIKNQLRNGDHIKEIIDEIKKIIKDEEVSYKKREITKILEEIAFLENLK